MTVGLPGIRTVSVYADGSSRGRLGGAGGYGWVVLVDGHPVHSGLGGHPDTTNNRMEVLGIIRGLEAVIHQGLHLGSYVEVVSDSMYALGMASGSYSAKSNIELVEQLVDICARANVARYRHVKGHAGDPYNEMCDKLAKKAKAEVSG